MLLPEKIKQLREEKQLLQRQLAEALEIDTPMYCKIERGIRPIKREQVLAISRLFAADEKDLLTLWLADKVLDVLEGEKDLTNKALELIIADFNKV